MTSLRSVVCIAALALVACAKDPTSGKTKAEVGAARTEVAAPAGGESLTVTAAESRVGFIGAKVTAQHEGSFKEVAGTILLVDADPVKSRVDMTVQTGSVELEPKKLGYVFRRLAGRVVSGYRLERCGASHNSVQRWRVVNAAAPSRKSGRDGVEAGDAGGGDVGGGELGDAWESGRE